jgi:hypothetical protein
LSDRNLTDIFALNVDLDLQWPGANITLRAGATVIEDTRRVRTAMAKYPLA